MGKISGMRVLRKRKRFGCPDTTPSRLRKKRKKKKHEGGVSYVPRKALGVFVAEMNTKWLAPSIFQIPSSLLLFCNRNLPLFLSLLSFLAASVEQKKPSLFAMLLFGKV
jgi:hypothetical protein